MTIHFIVRGHPVGYMRTTQAGCKFDRQYKRYQAYKSAVIAAFLDQAPGNWERNPVTDAKPLTTSERNRSHLSLKIYFKNKVHCDPDNCFKSIADSLFVSDKYVSGDFDFDYDPINPRVEVTIK